MTPDEIAREAVDVWWNHSAVPNMDSLLAAIAAAIRAERERAERAEADRDEWRAVAEKDRGTLHPLLSKLAEVQAERDRLRDALEPFAKAGELFARNPLPEGSVMMIYGPAAGDGYSLNSDHLVAAHAALRKTDTLPVGGDPVNNQGA